MNLAEQIEAKRKYVDSGMNLTEIEWTAIDSYNLALTEAAEIVRAESAKLTERIDELEEALRHYANKDNWICGALTDDYTEFMPIHRYHKNGFALALEVLND